jgi:hypothetical protein
MLTHSEVATYLRGQGLLDARAVVAGNVEILDSTRRNICFEVVSARAPSYLLKQGPDAERTARVAYEAAMYTWLHSAPQARRVRSYLAALHRYDAQDQVLVLELLPQALTLGAYHQRRGQFPLRIAALLGAAVGTLHQIGPGAVIADGGSPLAPCPLPWALAVHRPSLDLYCGFSLASIQLLGLLQQFPEFGRQLDRLRAEWQCQALVHYDLKGENLLVVPTRGGARSQVKLVDWELAGWGDPCWDVGSIFGEYLGIWLHSVPVAGEGPPDQFLELASYPLEQIQPAIRRFWEAYVGHMGLTPAIAGEWLLRATRYSAVRLLQTAFEESQTQVQLTRDALCFVQLSFNILQRPDEAALHLLGIPW